MIYLPISMAGIGTRFSPAKGDNILQGISQKNPHLMGKTSRLFKTAL
jgi:hypothetical protein